MSIIITSQWYGRVVWNIYKKIDETRQSHCYVYHYDYYDTTYAVTYKVEAKSGLCTMLRKVKSI